MVEKGGKRERDGMRRCMTVIKDAHPYFALLERKLEEFRVQRSIETVHCCINCQ